MNLRKEKNNDKEKSETLLENFRNSLNNSRPSLYLGCHQKKNENSNSFSYICNMIFKVGGDGHVIFKNSFGKEKRDEEILFCLNNPFSSNPYNMYEYLLFLVVQMNETHEELVSNLSQLNSVFEELEKNPLQEIFTLNLSQKLYNSEICLREFLEMYKVIPTNSKASIFSFQIRLKFVLGGDWKFLVACLCTPKILYSPFDYQLSFYRKEIDLFSRSQVFSPQEFVDYLPQLFRYALRDNGTNALFSNITSWFRWADLDLHMVIRIFTGLLKVEELVLANSRLKTKLEFLDKMFKFGVSRASSEFIPKDIGVKNYFFPRAKSHIYKREEMKSKMNLEKTKETSLKNISKFLRVEKFENLIDSFINVFSKMRKESFRNKNKFGHEMNDFQRDYLTFEEVIIIVKEIEDIWKELPNFENEFQQRSPYYLNFFFRGLVIHLSTWFLFSQTSQQTQELINLMMNNLHRKGSRYGGKPPKEEYYPVLGESTTSKNNRTLETMITVTNKFRISQQMKLIDDEDMVNEEIFNSHPDKYKQNNNNKQ